jgi:hypothetical protein
MKSTQSVILALLLLAVPAAVEAQFDYFTNPNGISLTIYGYSGTGGDVIIPPSINGLPVTIIDIGAFEFCTNLTSVTLPESVMTVGGKAFMNCTSLTSMTLPNSVTSIWGDAFMNCTSLTNVTIPNGVTNIGIAAFMNCTSLTNVTIPNSVTDIGDSAFEDCTSLTNVALPNSVTNIMFGAFYGTSLSSVTVPNSVRNIGDTAFMNCTSLTNVSIPNSVTRIGAAAFSGTSLTSVTIPSSVTDIEYDAFWGCSNLASVFFMGDAPTASGVISTNDNGNPLIAYYLPGTTGWDEFSIEAGVPVVLWNPLIQASGSNFGVKDNQFGFNITGTTNIPIVVEACTNLANPVWISLQSLELTNGQVYFSEPFQADSSGRFYRISSP